MSAIRHADDAHSRPVNRRVGLLLVLIAVNFVYFISSAYITCSNDGSHFALVSALAEKGSVRIRDYIEYTQFYDFNYKEGEYYSDRPPGTAFLAVPFYCFGNLASRAGLAGRPGGRANIGEVFVIFLPNIAGTLSAYLMYRLCRHFSFDYATSLFATLVFAFCTPAWIEATRLFSHSISMAAVLAAVFFTLTTVRFDHGSRRRIIGISFLLAVASIVEIQNVLFVLILVLYILATRRLTWRMIAGKRLRAWLLVALAVFAAVYSSLLIYNYAAFGEITIKSNKYNPVFPVERSFGVSLSGDPLSGLDSLFTNLLQPELIYNWPAGARNDAVGLFVLSPVLLLSLPGFFVFFKYHRSEALLFLVLVLSAVAVAAFHTHVHSRHVITIIPFLFIPAVYVFDRSFRLLFDGRRGAIARYSLLVCIFALVLVSLARVFYAMNTYWGRSLSTPFLFLAELPSYLLFYGVLAAAVCAALCIMRRRKAA